MARVSIESEASVAKLLRGLDLSWGLVASHSQTAPATPNSPREPGQEPSTVADGVPNLRVCHRVAPRTCQILEMLAASRRSRKPRGFAAESLARSWLNEPFNPCPWDHAIECLAWCHALAELGDRLTEESRQDLDNSLADAAQTAQQSPADPFVGLLMGVELPLTMARVVPAAPAWQALTEAATSALSAMRVETPEEELLRPDQFGMMLPLMASWTRCLVLAGTKQANARQTTSDRFAALLRHVLRIMRFDGCLPFADRNEQAPPALFFDIAANYVDSPTRRIVELSWGRQTTNGKSDTKIKLPAAAFHSEACTWAVLRTGWSRTAPSLVVSYGNGRVGTELCALSQRIWSGTWPIEVRCDGAALSLRGNWENVCWETDDDMDYLELEAAFTGGVRVQRQMLLSRTDGFLFLADALLARQSATLEYASALPISSPIELASAKETREVLIGSRRRAARAMPLALPEWRRDRRTGELSCIGQSLRLEQSCRGKALLAPLFIDLDPRRAGKPLTWRQLTVAENRVIQPAEVAVGYRVQIADQQWLFYRSLTHRGNRTVLGTNLVSEFLAARFSQTGEAETILEIE